MSTVLTTSERDYRPDTHELLNERYVVQKILGSGVCSRVWKCFDKVTNRNVAVKIAKNTHGSKMMARAEIDVLKALSEKRSQQRESKDSNRRVVELLDTFTIPGGFMCLTIDLLGSSLLPFAEEDGIPIDMVHGIIRQILEGLQFIHSKNIIHSDIKPENIAICKRQHPSVLNRLEELGFTRKILGGRPIKIGNKRRALNEPNPPNTCSPVASKRGRKILSQKGKCGRQEVESSNQENQYNRSTPDSTNKLDATEDNMKMPIDLEVKIFDFGLSFCPDKSSHGLTDRIQTAEYRCPEAILVCENQYRPVADVWSVGCMAFELWAGELLMRGVADNENEEHGVSYCSKEDFFHLKQIYKLVGPFPARMLSRCSRAQKQEMKRLGREVRDDPIKRRLYAQGKARSRDGLSDQELIKFAEFIQSMLVIDPEKRPKAADCLQHHWLRDRIRST